MAIGLSGALECPRLDGPGPEEGLDGRELSLDGHGLTRRLVGPGLEECVPGAARGTLLRLGSNLLPSQFCRFGGLHAPRQDDARGERAEHHQDHPAAARGAVARRKCRTEQSKAELSKVAPNADVMSACFVERPDFV